MRLNLGSGCATVEKILPDAHALGTIVVFMRLKLIMSD